MKRRKNLLLLAAAAAVIAAAVCLFKVSLPKNYYSSENPLWEDGVYIELTIDCTAAVQNWDSLDRELKDEKYVPSDGLILPPTKVGFSQGETPLDALIRAAKYHKISLDIQAADENSLGTAYIRGINQLYEFSCGELSGWMYSVNGKFLSEGCDSYILRDGDKVSFVYTCDLGRDIGGEELY